MAGFEKTLTIRQPVEMVFEFLTNGKNNPKWELEMVDSRQLTEGPAGVGTKWLYVRKFGGFKVETVSEIVEFEPNKRWAVASAMGPMPARGTILFEPVEGGTRLQFILKVETKGIFRLMDRMLSKMLASQSEKNMRKLKEILDG